MEVSNDLRELAAILADWAEPASGYQVFLFGSRVRNDHRPESDVDIHLWLEGPVDEDTVFWKMENEDQDYATVKDRLPGPLKILEPHDPLCEAIRTGRVIHVDRRVRCVWMPPKPLPKREASDDPAEP